VIPFVFPVRALGLYPVGVRYAKFHSEYSQNCDTIGILLSRTSDALLQDLKSQMGKTETRIREHAGVIVFSASWCGYCRKSIDALTQAGIEHEVVDVEVHSHKITTIHTTDTYITKKRRLKAKKVPNLS
jgi:glutaredoxin